MQIEHSTSGKSFVLDTDDRRERPGLVELLEPRRLLSAEPVALLDEVIVPGDLSIGAAPFPQYDPYIAAGPDGTSLAVWTDFRTGGHPSLYWGMGNGTMADVWGARIAADGTLIDQVPLAISIDGWKQSSPKAAWNGTNWLVVWSSEQDPYTVHLHATRLSADGVILDAEPTLIMDDRFQDQYGNPVDPEGPLDVQPNGSGWVTTWWRSEPNPASPYGYDKVFYATRVLADGTVHAADVDGRKIHAGPYNITNWLGFSYSSSNGGQFLQAFEYNGTIYTARRASDLSLIDTTFTTKAGTGINHYQSELVGSPSGWLLAYKHSSGVSALRLNSSNAYVDATPLALSSSSGDPRVSAAFDGNGYVVTYTQYFFNGTGFTDELYARRVPVTGAAQSQVLVQTLGNPAYAIHAAGDGAGRYSVLFADSTGGMTDIAVIKVAADNSTSGVIDVSNAARAHGGPKLASDGTNSLAVFMSFNQDEVAVKGVRLTPEGIPLESEPFTIVPESVNPAAAQVGFLGGRYVVTFIGDGPEGRIVYAQQVGTDGQLIGTRVAMTGGMVLDGASVLGDRMILTGNSREGTLHIQSRFARIFDENLAAVTDRFQIGTNFALTGDTAPVGDRWLATWARKSTHDAPRSGIMYTFIGTDGTVTGQTELVSTYPDNGRPTVATMGAGASEAMIIFRRWDPPTGPGFFGPWFFPDSGEGLVGQRMSADGSKIAGLFTLIDAPGAQMTPSAVFDGSNYVLTWVDGRNNPYPNQEHADVFAARVALDGTVLDPGGFAVAQSHRPEDSPTISAGAGRTFFAYRSFRYGEPYASYRIATRLLDDPFVPLSTGSSFDINSRQSMEFSFNERLPGLATAGVVLTNITTGQVIDPAHYTLTEAPGTANEWDYVIRPTPGNLLPDGNYQAVITDAVDKAGNPLEEPVVLDFYVLAGDATRDRYVNLADLAILRANFGQSGKTFSEGDFNYDSVVNLADLAILRGNFGMYLPPPPGPSFFGGGGDDDDDGGGGVLT